MTGKSCRSFPLTVTETGGRCPIGEKTGALNRAEGKIPVISCEGGCIRGEIARQAANIVARHEPFRRGCHGELLTVPRSAIAAWMMSAGKVVVIDGCFLRCHGRILENLLGKGSLVEFDALSVYRKYTDVFDADAVPETDRLQAAQQVASRVLETVTIGGVVDATRTTVRPGEDELIGPPSRGP